MINAISNTTSGIHTHNEIAVILSGLGIYFLGAALLYVLYKSTGFTLIIHFGVLAESEETPMYEYHYESALLAVAGNIYTLTMVLHFAHNWNCTGTYLEWFCIFTTILMYIRLTCTFFYKVYHGNWKILMAGLCLGAVVSAIMGDRYDNNWLGYGLRVMDHLNHRTLNEGFHSFCLNNYAKYISQVYKMHLSQ